MPLCPDAGPALRVSAASNVAIEMLQIEAPSFTDQLLIQGGTGIHAVKLDGPCPPPLVPIGTLLYGEKGTKRVLEYARLAMGFANVRASRYGIR